MAYKVRVGLKTSRKLCSTRQRIQAHLISNGLGKFAEQHHDIIGWEQSNRAYIMTPGVSGIDWKHCKHPLPEHVYDIYMKSWADVRLAL